MQTLLNPLLTLVLVYGYPIIAVALVLGYLGIPVPIDGILLASGAFSLDGTLNLYVLLGLVFIMSVAGDLCGYLLGSKFGYKVLKHGNRKFGISPEKITQLNTYLSRWGWITVFITRWLVTPLGIPVNITAGITKYPLRKFIIWVVIGEAIWTGLFIFAGRYFGANWAAILVYTTDVPLVFSALLIGSVSIYFGFWLSRKTYRQLKSK